MGTLQLNEIHKARLQELGVVLCYAHGSIAKGTARQDSDLDIAVLYEKAPKDGLEATTEILKALEGLMPERNMDIAILNEASPLFNQVVASTGELLYARSPEDSLRFELRAMHEYEYSRHIVRLGQEIVMMRAGI